MTAKELLARRYDGGVSVTNCIKHMHLSLLDREDDCRLCQADVRNHLSEAIAINKWLNEWKEEATILLSEES